MVTAVRRHYGAEHDNIGPEWAALEEFSLAPGAGGQRADLMLVRAWNGKRGHERHGVEVKVSRGDLLAELARPDKSAVFEAITHRFYLAAPAGLTKPGDPIPPAWGIYEISAGGRCREARKAKHFPEATDVPEGAFVEAFRRAARAEARIRSADTDDAAARVVELERQLASLRAANDRAASGDYRDARRLRDLLASIALAGGWVCFCGKRIRSGPWARTAAHTDGTTCEHPESYAGHPRHDMAALAERLGITEGASS